MTEEQEKLVDKVFQDDQENNEETAKLSDEGGEQEVEKGGEADGDAEDNGDEQTEAEIGAKEKESLMRQR